MRGGFAAARSDASRSTEHQWPSNAFDGRTTLHLRYAISQSIRKRVEDLLVDEDGGLVPKDAVYKGLDRTGLAA